MHVHHGSAGKDEDSNWLPAPRDEFVRMMRRDWPKEKLPSILDGSWKIPEVKGAS